MKLQNFLSASLILAGSLSATASDDCNNLMGNGSELVMTLEQIRTFGSGETRYINGIAVTTSRRLLRRSHRMSTMGMLGTSNDVVLPRTPPVPFPPDSASKVSLIEDAEKRLYVSIQEYWGFNQGLEGYFFGAGALALEHLLPVEFVRGTYSDFLAGARVHLKVTREGSVRASQDLQDIVTHDVTMKPRPVSLESSLRLNKATSELISEAFTELQIPEGEKMDIVDQALDTAKAITEAKKRELQLLTATPELAIELVGTNEDLTIHYLNDVTVHAIGTIHF